MIPRPRLDARHVAFALLAGALAVVARHHEIGHDEAQAWNIARSAGSILDVARLSRFEGHTPPWFAALWLAGRFGGAWVMQATAAGLTLACLAALLRDRPFGTAATVLVACGYYLIYEYSIIARPYVLALTLAVTFATLQFRDPRRDPLVPGLLCAAMALVSAYSALLSLALLTYLVGGVGAMHAPVRRRLALACAMWALCLAACVWIVLTPSAGSDFEAEMRGGLRAFAHGPLEILRAPVWPHLDRVLPAALLERPAVGHAASAATLLVLCAIGVRLRRVPRLLGAWIVAIAAVLAGATFSDLVSERHLGHLWIAALALCWIEAGTARGRAPSNHAAIDRVASVAIATALAWHALVGAAVAGHDTLRPMTPWNDLAAAVQREFDPDAVLVTDFVYAVGPLVAILDRPAYDVRCRCMTRFYEWTTPPTDDPDAALERAWCALAAAGRDVAVVAAAPDAGAASRLELVARGVVPVRPSTSEALHLWRPSPAERRRCAASGPTAAR